MVKNSQTLVNVFCECPLSKHLFCYVCMVISIIHNDVKHSKMVKKIQYLLSILLIIFILVFIQHHLPKKSAYNYISRHIRLLNHQKHKKPKQTKIPEPKNDPQLPSKDATMQKMVKGKLSNNPYKIRDKN